MKYTHKYHIHILMFIHLQRFYKALRPSEEWGPVNKEDRIKYKYATDYCSPDLLLHDVTIKAET